MSTPALSPVAQAALEAFRACDGVLAYASEAERDALALCAMTPSAMREVLATLDNGDQPMTRDELSEALDTIQLDPVGPESMLARDRVTRAFDAGLTGAVTRLRAVPEVEVPPAASDEEARALFSSRCPVCDWPLAATAKEGCVPGNCSYRPSRPERNDGSLVLSGGLLQDERGQVYIRGQCGRHAVLGPAGTPCPVCEAPPALAADEAARLLRPA